MKTVIISGSHRKVSQSFKVARFLEKRIQDIYPKAEASIISLAENPLPLWDESVWDKDPKWEKLFGPYSQKLREADSFIFVIPEWAGMVPPGFKNFLLLCTDELAHKPALLVSVSAGINGAYPIAEIRASGYKNNQVAYLPEHVIVRNAEKVLNDGEPIHTELGENFLRDRIDYSVKLLKVYSEAFTQIRNSSEIKMRTFPNGM